MSDSASPPPLSPAEALTRRFYEWEHRARGWDVAPHAVVLEPPFEPFFHALPLPPPGYDDGRRPGLGDWFRSLVGSRRTPALAEQASEDATDLAPPEPSAADAIESLTELQLKTPEDALVTPELAERMLLALGDLDRPATFELVGAGGCVALHLTVAHEDVPAVRELIDAFAPEVTVADTPGALLVAWESAQSGNSIVVDFGLSREAVLPVRTFRSLTLDPLVASVAVLSSVRSGEVGLLQVRFARAAYPWADSMLRAVSDAEGHAFFADAPEMRALTREKVGTQLFACSVRVAARAATRSRALEIAKATGRTLSVFGDPSGNDFIALANDDYADDEHEADVLRRQSRRSGLIISAAELAGIVHLPSPSVRAPGLRASARTTKAAPSSRGASDVLLGENAHRGRTAPIYLPHALRFRHTYVVGATGTGKSTLLLSLILQDIEAGRGVGLIDPHGDLVDDVLAAIPEERHKDVVLFDPADEECPVGFNVLQARTDRERDLVSSDLVAVFRRLSTSWGDQMTAVLGNAIMAFLESDEGGTLLDLRRFLSDKDFREQQLRAVRDPSVVSFFRQEFPLLHGRPQASILTRLDALLRPKQLRAVVSQRAAKLDLGAVMDGGGIFLARLAQGAIGEENAYLLGSLLVSKVHQMALARERLAEANRRDFFLYLDEFHNFVTPSLSALLSGARKFRVGLVLAHQELRQLGDREVAGAVLANAATRVCFRLGDDDARKLESGFSTFTAADLQSLGVGEAICRIERSDQDCNLRVIRPQLPDAESAGLRREAIRELSRSLYGTPRSAIDADIARAFAGVEPEAAPRPSYIKEEHRAESPQASAATRYPHPDVSPSHAARRPKPRRTSEAGVPAPVAVAGGRGGPQHKYLQGLIKRLAEERGFRATLEAPTEGGGRIDVLLSRDDLSVACEISIASTPSQEVENLRKCRSSGARRVVLVSPERRTLRTVEKLLAAETAEGAPVSFCTPEELLGLLDGIAAPIEEREQTVRGYRVRTTVRPAEPGEPEDRRSRVAGTILAALKRLKGNG